MAMNHDSPIFVSDLGWPSPSRPKPTASHDGLIKPLAARPSAFSSTEPWRHRMEVAS